MYIWFGIDVDKYFHHLTSTLRRIEKEVGLNVELSKLPFHISLIISKEIDISIKDDIIYDISNYLSKVKAFNISVCGIEDNGNNVVWIRFKENEYLNKIHEDILDILKRKYNLEQAYFDSCFIYHTSLFINDDKDLLHEAYLKIKDIDIVKEVKVERLLIGLADSLKISDFYIEKEINI